MGRGGKRPGAGAPKGNMNALKHGRYSQQFAAIGALLAGDPKVREALLDLGRKHGLHQDKSNEIAAYLLAQMLDHARRDGLNLGLPVHDLDSINEAADRVSARELRKAIKRFEKIAKQRSVNQTPDTNGRSQSEAAA